MAVVLCGDSARHVLEGLKRTKFKEAQPIDADDVVFESLAWEKARDLSLSVWGEPGLAADVLVRKHHDRKKGQSLTYHTWTGTVPNHSLVQLEDGTIVTTPWFELLLNARKMSMVQLSRRIMELTSIFEFEKNSEDGFVEAQPLVDRDFLESYVLQAKGIMGVSFIRDALAWSPPKARSPREIDLTLPLTLPKRLKGCGLPIPELNHEVSLDGATKRMIGQDQVFIDLYWKALDANHRNAGAEYLGKKRHDNIGKELTRANGLALEGIDVQLVANEQLKDAKQLLLIAKRIAESIGFRPFRCGWPSEAELQGLIDEVLGA
ncbi:MAG: hypothetical protein IJM67_09470 [Atopobiaceae bacterium]|nr:hypothetical protein [Atopobiaceae bacterium]